jgi:hypothetical protein
MLAFREIMTPRPEELSSEHAKATLHSDVSAEALDDAIAVITRYANALDVVVQSGKEFDRAAGMLLKRGYA